MSAGPRRKRLRYRLSVTDIPEVLAGYRHQMARILIEAIDEAVADEPPAVAARMRELALRVAAAFETGVSE